MIFTIHSRARVRLVGDQTVRLEILEEDGQWVEHHEHADEFGDAEALAQAFRSVCEAAPSEYHEGHGPGSYFQVEHACACLWCMPRETLELDDPDAPYPPGVGPGETGTAS